jgi:DNA-binding NarL/FixJ family response regulator
MPRSPKLPRTGPRPCLLLVEDDAAVRRSVHLMLQAQGVEVRAHAAMETALADPRLAECFHLVADQRLPDGDGIGLRRELAERGWRGRSVLVTAYPSEAVLWAAQECGFDAVLEKPAWPEQLLIALALDT